jgi:hypothetical protein
MVARATTARARRAAKEWAENKTHLGRVDFFEVGHHLNNPRRHLGIEETTGSVQVMVVCNVHSVA